MGWSIGFDTNWNRDIGYGVPAYCDAPKCMAELDRGLSYVCGEDPYGGEKGCGLFFCEKHLYYHQYRNQNKEEVVFNVCKRCDTYKLPYKKLSPEHPEWIEHKLTDESWEQWRKENPQEVKMLKSS